MVFGRAAFFLLVSADVASSQRRGRHSVETRIVGGVDVTSSEYPFQVSMQNFDSHMCGGSLIHPRFVLCAAHCGHSSHVAVGCDSLSGCDRRIKVKRTIIHPNYGSDDSNDISIVELEEAVTDIKPVELSRGGFLEEADVMATVTGFGLLTEDGVDIPNKLQGVDVPVVEQSVCNDVYHGMITDDMICAGYKEGGKDSCQGDSGGPLVVKNRVNNFVQIGVVSFGNGCARPEAYGVYSRVSTNLGFICAATNKAVDCEGVEDFTIPEETHDSGCGHGNDDHDQYFGSDDYYDQQPWPTDSYSGSDSYMDNMDDNTMPTGTWPDDNSAGLTTAATNLGDNYNIGNNNDDNFNNVDHFFNNYDNYYNNFNGDNYYHNDDDFNNVGHNYHNDDDRDNDKARTTRRVSARRSRRHF